MPEIKMFSHPFMPMRLERSKAAERLSPNEGRTLQHADVSRRPGKLMRGKGCAATQVSGSSTSVTGAAVLRRQDGKLIVIDSSTGGVVRITPGDGTKQYSGPLPEWDDAAVNET